METLQTASPATPDTVWAILREVAASLKETEKMIKENAAINAASQKELSASQKETAKQIKEIGKRHGDFTNSFGEMAEYMVAPNLQDRFFDEGLDFPEVYNEVKIDDKKSGFSLRINVYLQNSDTGMLVEVKEDLDISDINTLIERLEKRRTYADLRGDKRVFLGAVAGVVVKGPVKKYALAQGLYLVEPSGQTFSITPPHTRPKEW